MINFKKQLTTLLFVSFLLISSAQGQDPDNESTNPLQTGSRALQFQITDNFTLSSFEGATISYKRHFSEDRATRIGLNLNNRYRSVDYPDIDDQIQNSLLDLNLEINYTWMNYTNPESIIKFFYGYGPGVMLGFERSLQEDVNQKTTRRDISYGISGIGYAGVEWFFHSSMSLHAEYMTAVRLYHRRDKHTTEENGDEETNRVNRTDIRLQGEGVRFGLSVYF